MRCILDELSVCFYRGALVLIAVPSAPLENHGRSLLRWCYSINNKNKKSYCATLYSEPWTWETVENVGTFFLVLQFLFWSFFSSKVYRHTERGREHFRLIWLVCQGTLSFPGMSLFVFSLLLLLMFVLFFFTATFKEVEESKTLVSTFETLFCTSRWSFFCCEKQKLKKLVEKRS